MSSNVLVCNRCEDKLKRYYIELEGEALKAYYAEKEAYELMIMAGSFWQQYKSEDSFNMYIEYRALYEAAVEYNKEATASALSYNCEFKRNGFDVSTI